MATYKRKFICKSGFIQCMDPCYDNDSALCDKLKALCGVWEVKINVNKEGRVTSLVAIHESVKNVKFNDDDWFHCGVDAGLFGFFDNKPDYTENEWNDILNSEILNSNFGVATEDNVFKCNGVWSSTGYGDGLYPLYYLEDSDKAAYALKIKYI